MSKIEFTQRASEVLSGEEKRAAKVEVHKDGALRGWCRVSNDKNLAWLVDSGTTKVGMIDEVSTW